jgi:acetoin utilization protein AcuB
MATSPVTIGPNALVRAAADLMRRRKVRHLPVVDGHARLVGIVTDRDLRQVVFDPAIQIHLGPRAEALRDLTVRDVMTCGVVTVEPDSDIRQAARLMHERKIGALPVVDRRRLVGILSEHDVLRAFATLVPATTVPVRAARRTTPTGNAYDYGFPLSLDSDPWQDDGGVGN